MSVLGGMGESECQNVQARVRAATDTQVVNEGRHQGGRAPYGYVVVDDGPQPNPQKAAVGHRLRVLAVDDATADVVRRIFAKKLDGAGNQTIAGWLNRDGVPCPSMRWPDQNRHRLTDGWQASAVWAIVDNPRYTGCAFFEWWKQHEELLDPDGVAAGHVTRFRHAEPGKVVRSPRPPHPAIVSVETFTEAQMARRSRERRSRFSGPRHAPEDRPSSRERCRRIAQRLDRWAVAPGCRQDTVRRLLDADTARADTTPTAVADEAVADAEQRMRRLRAAIEAGVDPVALVEPIDRAQEELEMARFEQQQMPTARALGQVEVEAMLHYIGDVGAALQRADPAKLEELYRSLELEMTYRSAERLVEVTVQPRGW